jgi:hypothetical protein
MLSYKEIGDSVKSKVGGDLYRLKLWEAYSIQAKSIWVGVGSG